MTIVNPAVYTGRVFEWDERKSDVNSVKHRIPFSAVRVCFEGPLLARRDVRFHYGEERWTALGLLDGVPIVLIYTKRGERIRIISARKANRNERSRFERALAARGR